MSLVEEWRAEFRRLERPCPWPGPRPLTPEKDGAAPWRFVGRTSEMRGFLNAVQDHSLVLLHGESGAGKSSLLNVGLLPMLERGRFVPLVCNEWHGMRGSAVEDVITAALTEALDEDVRAFMSLGGLSLTEALDEVHDGRAVLVLDQFEELIRGDQDELVTVLRWLRKVNVDRRTKVVLSLRSEYLYRLDDFLRSVRPFSSTTVRLPPMTDPADIAAVVGSGNLGGAPAIEPQAADGLVEAWLALEPHRPERSLLYLHATLYALFWEARGQGRDIVTTDDLRALQEEADDRQVAESPFAGIFAAGFFRTIHKKMDLCEDACTVRREEDGSSGVLAHTPLVAATREQIRQSVAHLSSGGYKVQQELPSLFGLTAERELDVLVDAPGQSLSRAAVTRVVEAVTAHQGGLAADQAAPLDVLSAAPSQILRAAQVATPQALPQSGTDEAMAAFGVSPQPWVVDPGDVTAGVLFGRSPWEPMVEEVRAFAFAMEWLREASIVRISAPSGTVTATLVHDGFGPALKSWAAQPGLSPLHAVSALSAFRGEQWEWQQHGFLDGGDGWRVIPNVRWRACELRRTDLRRVVFVNCDFRGTRFVRCRLEGVTFVNCLLDGATFELCTVVGRSAEHDPRTPAYMPNGLPDFVLTMPEGLLEDFRYYRGASMETESVLYSPTSGVAAVPWAGDARAADAMKIPWSTGGLTMVGGRLSSLMFQGCDFSSGRMTLAHIAGSSLDLVEQEHVDLTLSWCAILGLTVSDKVGTQAVSGGTIRLDATECVLANTWLGPNLTGEVEVRASQIYGLTNLSPGLAVVVDNCAYGAVFNASTTDDAAEVFGSGTPTTVERTIATFANYSARIAYRSRPAEVELVRRVLEGRADG